MREPVLVHHQPAAACANVSTVLLAERLELLLVATAYSAMYLVRIVSFSVSMILPRYSYLLAGLNPQARLKIYPDAARDRAG